MTRANIILLLKAGKDPLDPSSYRPTSLLQSNIKILAKVLAIRVNKIILSIIHSDQAGFMPKSSTATNLRRLYLNMQTPADSIGHRALLSLDANKAFDSVGWQYLLAVLSRFGFGPNFLRWVRLLYDTPQAVCRIGYHTLSHWVGGLGRDAPCPLYSLLWLLSPLRLRCATAQRSGASGTANCMRKSSLSLMTCSLFWLT